MSSSTHPQHGLWNLNQAMPVIHLTPKIVRLYNHTKPHLHDCKTLRVMNQVQDCYRNEPYNPHLYQQDILPNNPLFLAKSSSIHRISCLCRYGQAMVEVRPTQKTHLYCICTQCFHRNHRNKQTYHFYQQSRYLRI